MPLQKFSRILMRSFAASLLAVPLWASAQSALSLSLKKQLLPAVPASAADVESALPATRADAEQVLHLLDELEAQSITNDKDLWARIRRGFAMPDLQDQYVTRQENWYAARPEYIGRMTERSRPYLYHIVEELERRKMPMELALLPFIESAFNPQAYSSAKAAGMWQFIPSTGKSFALKQNTFRDDRRDVQASTRAALDYLQKLHALFGDWHLALAAYNWGQGSVQRAIRKNQALGLGTSYAELNMPAETRNYVPKLQAVKNIVRNPEEFDAALPDIPNHPYFRAVRITRDMDVNLAARLAEVDIDDFKALNPSAKKSMIIASGTPEILLPWDNADIFVRNLQDYRGQLASYTAWVAPQTMRAADAARRAGMTESKLRSLNNIPSGMLIRGGSTLLVARSEGRHDGDISEHVADNAHMALAPEITMQRAYISAGKRETLAKTADRYGVSASSLAAWNGLSVGSKLRPHQLLVVMVPTRYGQKPDAPNARYAERIEKERVCKKTKTGKKKCVMIERDDAEQEKRLARREVSDDDAKSSKRNKSREKDDSRDERKTASKKPFKTVERHDRQTAKIDKPKLTGKGHGSDTSSKKEAMKTAQRKVGKKDQNLAQADNRNQRR